MLREDPDYLDYALKSFEIALELEPHEFYTPNCYLQIGKIYLETFEIQ